MGGLPSKPDPERIKSMQVIGAGFSRTGTVSLQLALHKLLDAPVMHCGTNFITEGDPWAKLGVEIYRARRTGDKEKTLKLLREFTAGYAAATDNPIGYWTPELLELYPEAKVVLMTRDPERWWQSLEAGMQSHGLGDLILPIFFGLTPGLRWHATFFEEYKKDMDELVDTPGNYGPHLLEAHNERIKKLVPKDQLLVMDPKEGWEPLCKFLGKPIPDEPFPRANEMKEFQALVRIKLIKIAVGWGLALSLLGGAAYTGWKTLAK
ncbi:P-loop containing nucleoside triphosphate hydrolase protein [Xylariales sp. PMI_506]|nr:P-loop containing nucleoside triphosphate hydrolase protein [Xylariales sp. PMI_506]